jgi:hypothetical protein
VSNTAHTVQFTLCALWSRTYIKYLQLRIFRPQYSAEGRSPAIGGISSIQWALYCKLGANYSAHPPAFAMCTVVRPYTKYLQLRIFRLQYSAEGRSPAIGGIPSMQWALYCKLGANYSAHPPVSTMWTVDPTICKVFTAPHIKALIFSCRYRRCFCRYHHISMRVIMQTWCQIQRTSSSLRYVNCGPGHIQCIYSSAYLGFNIQL